MGDVAERLSVGWACGGGSVGLPVRMLYWMVQVFVSIPLAVGFGIGRGRRSEADVVSGGNGA